MPSRPFGPKEIARLHAVYQAVLADIAEGDDLTDRIPVRDIRRKLAAGIIAAAQDGVAARDQLEEAGRAALRARASCDRLLPERSVRDRLRRKGAQRAK